ncbi:MAG: glycosyltransferase family 2 protein [Candidatus Kerfeldbacteria bacterium]
MKTWVVIPAFNEKDRILPIAKEALRYCDGMIIVDDGSDEGSRQILSTVPPEVRVLRHRINLGKGIALRTGARAAIQLGADIVVFMDSDGQHKPKDIPRFIEKIETGNVDIVFGARHIGGEMPIAMRIGNYFFSIATKLLFGIFLSDTQAGFRAFRSTVFEKIMWRSPRYAAETEMVVNAGKHHLRFCEIPIDTVYHDKYKGTTVIDGLRIFINMLIWRFS